MNNEDSSNRKRSSSLTEQSSRHRDRTLQKITTRPKQDDALYNFHMELAETCIDFLARHTFSPCSALPKRCELFINFFFDSSFIHQHFYLMNFHCRFPTVSSLLASGQSQSWLVGHNIITITTSGCNSHQLRNGLCDRCALLCKANLTRSSGNSSMGPTSPETVSTRTDSSSMNKRYTKASLQHTRYVVVQHDIHIYKKKRKRFPNNRIVLADRNLQVQPLQYHRQRPQHHIIKALQVVADSFVKHRMMPGSAAHPDHWNFFRDVVVIPTHPTIQIHSSIRHVRINRFHPIYKHHRNKSPNDRSRRAAVHVPVGRKYVLDVPPATYHG